MIEHKNDNGTIKIVKNRSKTAQSKSSSSTKGSDFMRIVSSIHANMEMNLLVNLPVTVFYSAYRNVNDVPSRIKNRHEFDQFSS